MRSMWITPALLLALSGCVETIDPELAQCEDGVDNDNDGRIDGDDFGCANTQDDTEDPDPPRCGNGIIENNEECDTNNLNGESCESIGFQGGILQCAPNCLFGTANCGVTVGCTNNVDDDEDGFIDLDDPGCTSAGDGDENFFADSCRGIGGPIFEVTFADDSVDVLVPGSTVGGSNDYSPTDFSDDCGNAAGPEIVLMYRVFTSQTITFSLEQDATDFDTVLYIRKDDCLNGDEICNDDDDVFGTASAITSFFTAGDYFIIIDGFEGASGNFELLIDLDN
jgi:hypothetical protein